jgi:hypothetical protein
LNQDGDLDVEWRIAQRDIALRVHNFSLADQTSRCDTTAAAVSRASGHLIEKSHQPR